MELNIPMKILAFCISSFQSSWHFAFYIVWELNTVLVLVMNWWLGVGTFTPKTRTDRIELNCSRIQCRCHILVVSMIVTPSDPFD
jgi:hypothetical protein